MSVGDVGFIPFALHFDGSLLLFMTLSSGATLYLLESSQWMSILTEKQSSPHRYAVYHNDSHRYEVSASRRH